MQAGIERYLENRRPSAPFDDHVFVKFLEGGDLEIAARFPAGSIDTTSANLLAAAMGEHEELSHLYPSFAATARKEGFAEIAAVWDAISVAEKQHEKRYRDLLANLEKGRVFKRDQEVVWRCRNCGYLQGTKFPMSARPAFTRRLTSNCWARIGSLIARTMTFHHCRVYT